MAARYRVILNGEGICIPHNANAAALLGIAQCAPEEDDPIIGFFTTRVVRGATDRDAVQRAIALVRADWARPPLKKINRGSEPTLTVDLVEKVAFLECFSIGPGEGYTFYTAERLN